MLSEADRERIEQVKKKVPKPRDPRFEYQDFADEIKDRQELPDKASEIEPVEAHAIEVPPRDSSGAIIEIIDKDGKIREFDIEHLDTELVEDNIITIGPPTAEDTIASRTVRVGGKDMELPIPKIINLGTKLDGQEVFYKIVDSIGSGGMAIVFSALPCNPEGIPIKRLKPVALKIAFDKNRSNSHERHLREIALHAAMNPSKDVQTDLADKIQAQREEEAHEVTRDTSLIKKVPAFYGAARINYGKNEEGQSLGNAFVVAQEYCPGETLGEVADGYKDNRIPAKKAMRMMLPVVETLMEMHAQGIIYRDIKPANIMSDKDNPRQTTLVDFGLSRDQFGAMHHLKSTGREDEVYLKSDSTAGTPLYMSPWQVEGYGNDPASDVYGLGLTFLEMIGAIKFNRQEDSNALDIFQKIVQGDFVLPVYEIDSDEFKKEFPTDEEQEFVKLLFKMMEPPVRSEILVPAILEFREKLNAGKGLLQEERFRLEIFLSSYPNPTTIEKEMLERQLEELKGDVVLDQEQKEQLTKKFNRFVESLYETVSHRGMFEVCRRLDGLIKKIDGIGIPVETEEYPGDIEQDTVPLT